MEFLLNKSIVKLEIDGKVLLFNPFNMEIVICSKTKYYTSMEKADIDILKDLSMLDFSEMQRYEIYDFYPNHISKAYILFGTDCNISCQYCTVQHNARSYGFHQNMLEETLTNCLNFLFKTNNGLEHITLYGGEPLLHKNRLMQFFSYLEKLPKEKVPRIDIITNGIIIDQDIINQMKKWDVLVLVSLDGQKKHHDMFRKDRNGEGTYSKTILGIESYQNAGIRVGISMVLGKHNYKDIGDICAYMKEKYNIISIGITLPHMEPDVVFDRGFQEFLYNDYSILLEVCQLQGLWFEQGMKRLLSLAEKKHYIYGCPSSLKGAMIRILPDGNITLCENMGLRKLFQICNVNDTELAVAKIIQDKKFINWYSRCTNNRYECLSCRAYAICGMGCPYDAYLQSGTIDNIEQRNCVISKQLIDWYLQQIIKSVSISNKNTIKVLNIQERKSVLVDSPWQK